MFESKRKDFCFPYDDLITKVLECVGFNLEGEEDVQVITIIGEASLGKMRFKIVNGEIFQKPPKG